MKPQSSIDITIRFKQAFEYVQGINKRGMKVNFCRENNINNNQLNNILKCPEARTLPPYYIACLCKCFNVSSDWVLLGIGDMFSKKRIKKHKIPTTDK